MGFQIFLGTHRKRYKLMKVDWHDYTSQLTGATGTDTELLNNIASGFVLDIGCGLGKHLSILNEAKSRVGIDPGLPALIKGRQLFPTIGFTCGSAFDLPFPQNCFDTVLMIDVIEHLSDPFKAVEEVRRILKPRGTLFVQTPNYPIKRVYDFWHWAMGRRSQFKDDETHVSRFTYWRLTSVVSQAGLEIRSLAARNLFWDKYYRTLRRFRSTFLGCILGQKVILLSRKPSK